MTGKHGPEPFELDPATARVVPESPRPSREEEEQHDAEEETLRLARRPRGRARLALLGGVALILLLLLQAVLYVVELFETTPLLAPPFAILLGLIAFSVLGMLLRELRDLRRLQKRAHLRQAAERLAVSELHGDAAAVLEPVAGELGRDPQFGQALVRYRGKVSDAYNDGELVRLFEREVLAPADRRAYRLVLASARDVGLLTALSPLGLLDGLLVLWRTMLMLRAISRLYGMAPGPAATLSLMRRSLRNAALAGLADVVTHATVEHVGAGVAALLSARAGQGAGNALLAAKLGIEAVKVARPLPFVAEEPPRLRHVSRALFGGAEKQDIRTGG
ncbi:TIGR01620 family protein [Geminicoccaceae bacterium 1502E]|nr:TIGR01620 family protein [Geminicoccaceae bacterium 1502E]